MKRKVISVILVAGMISAMLAGCGGTEAGSSDTTAANTDTSAAAEEGADTAAATDLDFNGTELTIKLCNSGCTTDGTDRVEEAINAITQEKLGLTINIDWVGIADYGTQMNLLFSSQESCDIIMTTPVLPFSAMKNQDELMDISEYLDAYGQDILAATGDSYLKGYTDGDAIYGVPTYRQKGGSYWINMRTDILDELGLTEKAQNMSSWTEFEEILDAVKEAHPEMSALYVCPNNNVACFYDGTYYTAEDSWADDYGIDNLGDSNYLVYVDDSGTVQSYYQSELFSKNIALAKELYDKGYVNSDCTTVSDDGAVACKNGKCFAYIGGGECDNAATQSLNTGYDMTCIAIESGVLGSFVDTMWGFALPYTCENPEASVAFLNLMYTDSELANLFVWGEEGVDWETTEDGYAQYVGGGDSSEYHSCTWLTPSAIALTPWVGGITAEEAQEAMSTEVYSEYLGFNADTTNIEQEVTSCVNVVNEYRIALVAGAAGDSTDSMYQEMCEKLTAAGIDTIVAEYQTQLDAWKAAQ